MNNNRGANARAPNAQVQKTYYQTGVKYGKFISGTIIGSITGVIGGVIGILTGLTWGIFSNDEQLD
jgi:hypothetical protein